MIRLCPQLLVMVLVPVVMVSGAPVSVVHDAAHLDVVHNTLDPARRIAEHVMVRSQRKLVGAIAADLALMIHGLERLRILIERIDGSDLAPIALLQMYVVVLVKPLGQPLRELNVHGMIRRVLVVACDVHGRILRIRNQVVVREARHDEGWILSRSWDSPT